MDPQFRIHEDQENQRPKLHAVKSGAQKKTALGPLSCNNNADNVQKPKDKKPLALSKTTSNANIQDKENWGGNKENQQINKDLKNFVNPIIPVAQFEAFKVYEDEEKLARIEEKLRSKSTYNVYKGNEERFFSKTEVADMQRKGIIPKPPSPVPSPMSVERSCYRAVWTDEEDDHEFFNMEEYGEDIYKYLREHELKNRAKPGYIQKQPDITASMRTILVDWLVEVAEEYKLHTETLYLAINYIDRFLSYMSVIRSKLQLVGTAAMFLASKYEEIYPPEIGEFVYITDDTYTKKQIIRMEQLIVKVLGFGLSAPTPLSFITAISVLNSTEEKVKMFAMYLCELSMLDGEAYLGFLPSELACSAIIISQYTLDLPIWSEKYVSSTGYQMGELVNCIHFIYNLFLRAPKLPQHAVQDKYKAQKHHQVSQILPKSSTFPKIEPVPT
ncbi:G2/mitotic-specific cyclin-A [Anthonomus grandis grandis]|uniref:G2/mitotic-specific cyclin-A n=1 Tax=Anthonomus grandis grandis TaxID=2921223 RepID=UPI002165B360|nr:G2/mitotic-specific cyclin-A [Anthonomus grandis grandis]